MPKECYGATTVVGRATLGANAAVTDNKDYFLGTEFKADSKLASLTACTEGIPARLVGMELGIASAADYSNVVKLPSVGFVNSSVDCTTFEYDKDTIVEEMNIFSGQFINSASIKTSDGKRVVIGTNDVSDLNTPWDFTTLGLIGLNGKSQ